MASEDPEIRPTKAVVVRALRDMLRPVISGTVVLELFAGTGRVGRALLDEGARRVVGVDRDDPLEEPPENYEWLKRDVESILEDGPGEPVDVIFMDPPYESNYPQQILRAMPEADWLQDQGLVIVETARGVTLPDQLDNSRTLSLMRKRNYGGSRLWVYQANREQPGYRK